MTDDKPPPIPGSRVRAGVDMVLVAASLVLDLLVWGFDGHTRLGVVIPVGLVAATAVPVFATLLLRRRRPWTAFLSLWLYTVIWGALLPTYQPFTGLLIVLYQFARRTDSRTARQPLPLMVVPWAINTYDAVIARGVKPVDTVVTASLWLAMAATVWAVGRAGYRTQRIFELKQENQAAEAALTLQQERLHLARELHDIVTHAISAVMFQAAGAMAAGTDLTPKMRETLQNIETSSTQAMRELRRLLGLLQPDGEALEAFASLSDLDQLLATTRACQIDIKVVQDGTPTCLDPSVDHTAYRVLQEALTNTMKHGGVGAQADVHLAWSPDQLCITVRSQPGLTTTPSPAVTVPSGYGLRGLHQRVTSLGGHLEAGPTSDGFLVMAELPIQQIWQTEQCLSRSSDTAAASATDKRRHRR